jgi:hypothetical protein
MFVGIVAVDGRGIVRTNLGWLIGESLLAYVWEPGLGRPPASSG